MRIATFNAENMFYRPKIMNFAKWSDGQAILDDYRELVSRMQKSVYSAQDKTRMKALIRKYKLHERRARHEFMVLRDNPPRLLQGHKDGSFEITANGRSGAHALGLANAVWPAHRSRHARLARPDGSPDRHDHEILSPGGARAVVAESLLLKRAELKRRTRWNTSYEAGNAGAL